MKYQNMIKSVKAGKTFTKKSWDGGKYIKVIEDDIYLVDSNNAKIIINYFPEDGDVEADDWEEHDPPILKTERGMKEKRNVAAFCERQRRVHKRRFEVGALNIPKEDSDAIDNELGAKMRTHHRIGGWDENYYETDI